MLACLVLLKVKADWHNELRACSLQALLTIYFHHNCFMQSYQSCLKSKKKEKRLDKISKDCHEDQHTKQSHSVIEHRTLFDENYQHSLQRDLTMWLVSCTGPRHLHSRQNCGKTHLMWAMGEVHASDVHSGFDHLFQHLHRPGGWPCRQSLKVKD